MQFFYAGSGFRSNGLNRRSWALHRQDRRCRQPSVVACLSSRCYERRRRSYGPPPKVRTVAKFPQPQKAGSLRPIPGCHPSVLCSKRNIILEWLIALRARASLVRDVGFGLWLANEPKVARTRKSLEKAAPRRSVERNSNLRLASLGFLKCLCLFSSVVTFIGLN